MVVKETIRTTLEQHPKLLTAVFMASMYSVELLEVGTSSTTNGP